MYATTYYYRVLHTLLHMHACRSSVRESMCMYILLHSLCVSMYVCMYVYILLHATLHRYTGVQVYVRCTPWCTTCIPRTRWSMCLYYVIMISGTSRWWSRHIMKCVKTESAHSECHDIMTSRDLLISWYQGYQGIWWSETMKWALKEGHNTLLEEY